MKPLLDTAAYKNLEMKLSLDLGSLIRELHEHIKGSIYVL